MTTTTYYNSTTISKKTTPQNYTTYHCSFQRREHRNIALVCALIWQCLYCGIDGSSLNEDSEILFQEWESLLSYGLLLYHFCCYKHQRDLLQLHVLPLRLGFVQREKGCHHDLPWPAIIVVVVVIAFYMKNYDPVVKILHQNNTRGQYREGEVLAPLAKQERIKCKNESNRTFPWYYFVQLESPTAVMSTFSVLSLN